MGDSQKKNPTLWLLGASHWSNAYNALYEFGLLCQLSRESLSSHSPQRGM